MTPLAISVFSSERTWVLLAASAAAADARVVWTPTVKLTVSGVPWTVPVPVTVIVAGEDFDERPKATPATATITTTRIATTAASHATGPPVWRRAGAGPSAGASVRGGPVVSFVALIGLLSLLPGLLSAPRRTCSDV